jgi:RNA polymerase primary sigma factor
MRQNKAPKQLDAIRSLLDKARKDNRVNQSEINALFSDSSSKQAQDFYAELETMGVEIFSEGIEIDDEDDIDLDLDLDVVLDAELEVDLEPEDVELEDLEEELYTRPMGLAEPELANDPVRMYLKEIGQVQLLDSNQEIWLSAQMAASRMVDEIYMKLGAGGQLVVTSEVMLDLFGQLEIGWNDVLMLAAGFHLEPPDLVELIQEGQRLRSAWWKQSNSYLHRYLMLREWGRDEEWAQLARRLFVVFEVLYLMPEPIQVKVLDLLKTTGCLPEREPFMESRMNLRLPMIVPRKPARH